MVGKVYICIIMEHTNTAIVLSDSISTDNPIFSGVYNLAVKIRVSAEIWDSAVSDWEQSLFFFFNLFSFFLTF